MRNFTVRIISEVAKGIGISLEASAIFSFVSHQIDFPQFIFFVISRYIVYSSWSNFRGISWIG